MRHQFDSTSSRATLRMGFKKKIALWQISRHSKPNHNRSDAETIEINQFSLAQLLRTNDPLQKIVVAICNP